MLLFSIAQFCTDCPCPIPFNSFNLHWNVIKESIKRFYSRCVRFCSQNNSVSMFSQYIDYIQLIITLAKSIDAFLFRELVLFMQSTYSSRFFVVRNFEIIIVLQ